MRTLARALPALFLLAACSRGSGPDSAVPSAFGPSDEAIDGRLWLEETAAEAEQAGAGPLQVLAVGPGTPGDHVPGLVNVPQGRCALLYARGSRSVDDIDLFVYGDDGAQFGSDEAPDDVPTLLVCPDSGRRLYVAARVAAGQGIVALGVQEVAVKSAEAVARAAGARNFGGQATAKADAWPGLTESLAAHRAAIGGTWEDLRRVALPVDSRVPTRLTARVAPNTCVDALILASDEVAQLEVEVLDDQGRIFGRSPTGGLARSVVVCSGEDAKFTYEIRPHAGRGLAVLALSSTPSGADTTLSEEAPRFDLIPRGSSVDTRKRENARLAAASVPAPRAVHEGTALVGSRTSVDLTVGAGCSRIDVWSTGELLGLEANAWSSQGRLLASATGLSRAPLFVCGDKARLDVEATRRKGTFVVDQRQDPGAPSALVRQGLAASRLLSRMHESGALEMPREVGAVREVVLSETELTRLALAVPLGRCTDVFVAVGPGGSGAEVRLVDAENGLEIALSRGTVAATARACALENGPIEAIAELRSAHGKATALVTSRLVPLSRKSEPPPGTQAPSDPAPAPRAPAGKPVAAVPEAP